MDGKSDKISKKNGIGITVIKNSSHFGAAGIYELMAARNMIGFVFTNVDSFVAADDEVAGKNKRKIRIRFMVSSWKNINISAEDCMVVENAFLGIKAAKTACLYCIALQTTLKKGVIKESRSRLSLKNHMELLSYFQHSYE